MPAKKRVRRRGRPANPAMGRLNVVLDRAVKKRAIICATRDNVAFGKVLDAALREYLDRRGM